MNHPWKYLTNSMVIKRLIGTKLFMRTHHVPNFITKNKITFISNNGEISYTIFFIIVKILSF